MAETAQKQDNYADLFGGSESDEEEAPPVVEEDEEAEADAADVPEDAPKSFKAKLEERAQKKREALELERAQQEREKRGLEDELEDDLEDEEEPGPSAKRQRVDADAGPSGVPPEGVPPEDFVAPETDADRAFIDDTEDAEGAARYKDAEDNPVLDAEAEAEEAEEDEGLDEVEAYIKNRAKARNRDGLSGAQAEHTVNSKISQWELAAEMDMAANAEGRPAVAKLKLLNDLETSLAHRELQSEYLDRGVLGVLKAWLEPLPDGNLPNVKVRTSVLRVLSVLPVDTALPDRRQQLKQSNIGKVVMFLYRLDMETPGNRRAAKELVERWSRPILREHRDEMADSQARLIQEREMAAVRARRLEAMKDEEKVANVEREVQKKLRPGQTGFRYHARMPRAAHLDYVRHPENKVDADAQKTEKNATQAAMKKKLQALKNKGKNMTGAKVSIGPFAQ